MKGVIDFLKYRIPFLALSLVVIIAGLAFTINHGGFNLGVDFQAGLRQQVQIDPERTSVTIEQVRESLTSIAGAQVQTVGSAEEQRFSIRVIAEEADERVASELAADVMSILRNAFGDETVVEESSNFVGPGFSAALARQTFMLTAVALVLILLYVWIRFRLAYAIGAIAPLLHDVAFMLVFIGTFQIEVSTATVAAVLTVIGYSLNDTIVIFDRIRENESLMRNAGFYEVVNTSITQSLTRTVITSFTTLLAVAAIFVFATGTIQDFALNLIVGVLIGTYSSIYIASPVLLALQRKLKSKREVAARQSAEAPARSREQAPAAATAGAAAGSNGSAPVVDRKKAADVKEEIRKQREAAGKGKGGKKKKK